jgi:hypothetical protein
MFDCIITTLVQVKDTPMKVINYHRITCARLHKAKFKITPATVGCPYQCLQVDPTKRASPMLPIHCGRVPPIHSPCILNVSVVPTMNCNDQINIFITDLANIAKSKLPSLFMECIICHYRINNADVCIGVRIDDFRAIQRGVGWRRTWGCAWII